MYMYGVRFFIIPPLMLLMSLNFLSAQEIDAVAHLNQALLTKPPVLKVRPTTIREQICRPNMHGPIEFRGIMDCYWITREGTEQFEDFASVQSSQVIKASDIVFGEISTSGLPEKIISTKMDYKNCGDVTSSISSTTLSISGTKSYSFSKTKGVSNMVGGNIGVTGAFSWGTVNVGMSFSQTISTSTNETEGHSETVSRSHAISISAGSPVQGTAVLFAVESQAQIPFSATIVVDGPLTSNVSGLSTASQLLTEAERTLPIEGIITLQGFSEATFENQESPEPPNCGADDIDFHVIESKNEMRGFIDNEKIAEFVGLAETQSETKLIPLKSKMIMSVMDVEKAASDGSSFGVPDGTYYRVVSMSEVSMPAAQCGFNDLGIPNPGIYTSEQREFTVYSNGQIVSRWVDFATTFKQCLAV